MPIIVETQVTQVMQISDPQKKKKKLRNPTLIQSKLEEITPETTEPILNLASLGLYFSLMGSKFKMLKTDYNFKPDSG